MAVIYILFTFIWIPLDGIWFYPVLSACICAIPYSSTEYIALTLLYFRILWAKDYFRHCFRSRECERVFRLGLTFISFYFCVTVALSFALFHSYRLHIMINPMFTQFTVRISNPKTNKYIERLLLCESSCIAWIFGVAVFFSRVFGERFSVWSWCTIRNEMLTKWNETKRVIFSI